MFDTVEFLRQARLNTQSLDAWIAAGWLLPHQDQGVCWFAEIDVARAQLIQDLKSDLGINDEGVDVILDLVDQIHGLRRTLRHLTSSIHAQPDRVRQRIVAELRLAASAATAKKHRPRSKQRRKRQRPDQP
jgi:chaperone modulatory protein CbpM